MTTTRDGLEYALEADWSLANLEVCAAPRQ